MVSLPKRAGGRTAVIVASSPHLLVKRHELVEVDVGHAVAIGHQERVVADERPDPLSRPPVCVDWPVSTSVTRQSSRGVSSTSTELVAKSMVTSAPSASESAKKRLIYSPL